MSFSERSEITYRVITLDVWGNEESGFEVNDKHYAGYVTFVTDEGATYNVHCQDPELQFTDWWVSEEQICQVLKDDHWLKIDVSLEQLNFEFFDPFFIQISDAQTTRPLFDLEYQSSTLLYED